MMRCKIKPGAPVGQDHHYGKWPYCLPPDQEFDGINALTNTSIFGKYYEERTLFPDAVFECEWNGSFWNCKRDGYGSLKKSEKYGNGSIFVFDYLGVEILGLEEDGDWW